MICDRGVGTVPSRVCDEGARTSLEGGLCYKPAPAGFKCLATACGKPAPVCPKDFTMTGVMKRRRQTETEIEIETGLEKQRETERGTAIDAETEHRLAETSLVPHTPPPPRRPGLTCDRGVGRLPDVADCPPDHPSLEGGLCYRAKPGPEWGACTATICPKPMPKCTLRRCARGVRGVWRERHAHRL